MNRSEQRTNSFDADGWKFVDIAEAEVPTYKKTLLRQKLPFFKSRNIKSV